MNFKGFVQLEEHAVYILFLSFLVVLWWVAVWGLIDYTIDEIEKKYGITPQKQYFFILAAMILLIGLHPQILVRM